MELVSAGKPAAFPAFQMETRMLKIVDNEGYMKIKLNKHYLHYKCDVFCLTFFVHFRVFLFLHEVKKLSIEGEKEKVHWSSCLQSPSIQPHTAAMRDKLSFLLNYYSLYFYMNLFKILPFCKLK